MNKINIISEEGMEKYLSYFNKITGQDIDVELSKWEDKIQNGEYNQYEFQVFLKILEIVESESPRFDTKCDSDAIDELKQADLELNQLIDYLLDKYKGTKRENELLDKITQTSKNCEEMIKHYAEKIIN